VASNKGQAPVQGPGALNGEEEEKEVP